MKNTTVSVTEGKKGFSRFIQRALDKREKITITKRGKPVAVIIPYDEYQRSRRLEAYKKIMEAREVFLKAGLKAREVYKESKKQLGKRS
jgi:prevent-host-death family protein